MLTLRAHLLILAAAFLLMMALVAALWVAQGAGATGIAALPVGLVLIVLLVFVALAAVPVMVKLVLGAHRIAGTADEALVRRVAANERVIIYAMWALMISGSVVAIPAAMRDGLFAPDGVAASQGVLVARPGMSREEMDAASTLALPSGDVGVISGEGVFEFRVAGTGLVFPGSRTYYVAAQGPALQVDHLLISVSGKLTRPERDAAQADTRRKLVADGWLEKGPVWAKDGLSLEVSSTQVDLPPAGQTEEQAPVWVQSITLQGESGGLLLPSAPRAPPKDLNP